MQRNYSSTSDVNMLLASSAIISNAIEDKTFLIEKRPGWADPFFPDLNKRINDAFTNILGIDKYKELKETTTTIGLIKTNLLADLSELKVQLKEEYKHSDKPTTDNLLQTLGLSNSFKYKTDQQALIETSQRVATNLTPELKKELTEKGFSPKLFENITENATKYLQIAQQQEALKNARPALTTENLQELNNIYDAVIAVSKIARNFFKGQPEHQRKYSFTKVLQTISMTKAQKQAETDTNTTTTN